MEEDVKINNKHSLTELEELFQEAESIDQSIFSEMRSNVQLIAGDHYSKGTSSKFHNRLRDPRQAVSQQKLRITKNYVRKIHKIYLNHILGTGPNVGFEPHNNNELKDTKAAQLHEAVWRDAEDKQRLKKKIKKWAEDYVGIGECAVKQFYVPDAGALIGHEPLLDKQGQEVMGEDGFPIPDEDKPIHVGEIQFEQIHGFNLLRSPDAKEMEESPYLIERKMVNVKNLKLTFPDKADKIKPSNDDTFMIMDANSGAVRRTGREETMVKEFYFRPSPQYPEGYFYIHTKELILASGPLPGGIFPIVFAAFDEIPTSPRGRSFVKQARAPQAEINRTSSKIAEHQITLGDDKILIQNGTKVTAGATLPGVRSVNYTGIAPVILPGRTGEQYLPYLQSQIQEIKDITNTERLDVNKIAKMDAHALLFQAASDKKEFSLPIATFEQFLVDIVTTHLRLAKAHLEDFAVIKAVGSPEQINIQEFRDAPSIHFSIKIVPQADDLVSKMGKQLALNHILQFSAGQMDKQDIGRIIRAMPFVNEESVTEDLTIDYDSATNAILALDRGQLPRIFKFDNHLSMIARLSGRMRKADFDTLSPQIQNAYEQAIQVHEQMESENVKAAQALKDGFIPTTGPLVGIDFFVRDPKNPEKTRRARIPFSAVQWLIEKIESQGQKLEDLEQLEPAVLADMARNVIQVNQGQNAGSISA